MVTFLYVAAILHYTSHVGYLAHSRLCPGRDVVLVLVLVTQLPLGLLWIISSPTSDAIAAHGYAVAP